MSNSQTKSITIVGGGSSGWMTAMYLNHLYKQENQDIHIRLVESPDIGILGVGEATVHSIRFFFAAMGLDESELLKETQATFKTGIMFKNWMKPVDGEMHQYFHPFEQLKMGNGFDISSSWLLHKHNLGERYDEGTCISSALIKHDHSPKAANSKPYMGIVPYGYHIDANQLARFLRKKAVAAGVEHIEANVSEVKHQDQTITSIITDHGEFSSDYFIDCTGFKGLLINAISEDNWVSYEEALPCNKAVAVQRKYKPGVKPKPYTEATALTNGWVWEIDLANRQGTGYVYDGSKLTKEQAEAELKSYLGNDSEFIKTLHLDMNIGRRKQFWVGNCITIGLSGGFIEPLESTGLHLINLGARLLSTHLVRKNVAEPIRQSYSDLMTLAYEDLKQFIVLHYCITNRDDTEFWQQAQRSVDYCPELKKKLAVWQHKVCEYADLQTASTSCFNDENYRFILYGMQYYPDLHLSNNDTGMATLFETVKKHGEQAVKMTLSHEQAIAAIQNNEARTQHGYIAI